MAIGQLESVVICNGSVKDEKHLSRKRVRAMVMKICLAGGTMDIFDVFSGRHSIRAFTDQPVTDDALRKIFEAINRAPSAGNLQAFDIYQVTKMEHKEALMRASYDQEFLVQSPVVLVLCATPARSIVRYAERGETLYCIQDATIACTYAMLAATALGLGSVWVGAFDESAVHKIIGAEPGQRPVAMLPIGYPNETPRIRQRRSLNDIVHPVG
jgi:nitroreductase